MTKFTFPHHDSDRGLLHSTMVGFYIGNLELHYYINKTTGPLFLVSSLTHCHIVLNQQADWTFVLHSLHLIGHSCLGNGMYQATWESNHRNGPMGHNYGDDDELDIEAHASDILYHKQLLLDLIMLLFLQLRNL